MGDLKAFGIHMALLALFVWLLRPRKSILGVPLHEGSVSIRSHRGIKILAGGVGLLGFFFLILSIGFYTTSEGIQWGVALPTTLVGLGIIYWVVRVFTLRIEADSNGIRYLAGLKTIIAGWGDINSIEWSPQRSSFMVRTLAGNFAISGDLDSLPLLFKIVSEHRPDLINPSISAGSPT